ncbi:monomeric sarcosine oxidase-like [Penaeus monodon]|uniref:monomeric sarcosine oxidase-like n=1 Tax=Penaeus monodon TaxID=6687 RepID=UPI0018A702B0|nr:monomeric sarcosine oxidase-like [Penaeus monodon]
MSSSQDKVYDLVIVGAGMIGSASAYYASQIPGMSVCLIGPPEPVSRKGHEIFGCWFDEGRICRRVAFDHTWSVLATKSIDRFRTIEKKTGINFYTESGFVFVTKDENEFSIAMERSQKSGLAAEDITMSWKTVFPYLEIPENAFVFWERNNAGFINPRQLVKAHQMAARQNRAQVVQKIVSTIQFATHSGHRWVIETECGDKLRCANVLVAAGGFAGLKPLFRHVAPGLVPDLELRTQTVSFLRISEEEAQRLKTMPTIVTRCAFENLDGAYVLPPIKYPDGHWYVKLGHGRVYEEKMRTLSEVSEWYAQQTGIPECVDCLTRYMKYMLPDLKMEEVSGDGCLTSHTPNNEPYIDLIAPGFGVALGGNGYAAKASDEIGRLAARLVLLGEWKSEIPKDRVKMIWKAEPRL